MSTNPEGLGDLKSRIGPDCSGPTKSTQPQRTHPLAQLFPQLDGQAFDDLCADIAQHGLHNPIVLVDGVLLDGRNRLRACETLNIEPTFVEFSTLGLQCTPEEYIWSQNMARRHLTDDQRAMIAMKWADQIKDAAKQRQKVGKGPDGSGGRGKKNLEADSPEGFRDANRSRCKVAQMARVTTHKIRQAEKVRAVDLELESRVVSGETGLRDAVKLVSPKTTEKTGSHGKKHFSKALVEEQLIEIYNGFERAHASIRLKRIVAYRDQAGIVLVEIRTVDKTAISSDRPASSTMEESPQ